MLRPQPTALSLKQEDLKEYENARATWVTAESRDRTQAQKGDATGGSVGAKDDRRTKVHARIGLAK